MNTFQAHVPKLSRPHVPSKGDFASLLDMAPSGMALLSPRNATFQGVELVSNALSGKRFMSVLGGTQAMLRETRVPILIDDHRARQTLVAPSDLKRPQRRWLGQLALELYFAQIFRGETAVVDLWSSRFGVDADGDAVWRPRPIYIRWDATFQRGVRNVYAGLFLENEARFEHGIATLKLGPAGEALRRHFGDGDQRSVHFESAALQTMLQEMATRSRDRNGPLHRNFMAFGLYIAGLYELLESLDRAFDVRNAFARIYRER